MAIGDADAEQCNLPWPLRGIQDDAGNRGIFGKVGGIGKMLVSHFHSLLKNPLPGVVCQSVGVIDGLGYGVPGYSQCVGYILDSDFFIIIQSFVIFSIGMITYVDANVNISVCRK